MVEVVQEVGLITCERVVFFFEDMVFVMGDMHNEYWK